MKNHRFYQAAHFEVGLVLTLDDKASTHISRVLRLKPETVICLFNGQNQQSLARLVQVEKRQVVAELLEVESISRESPFKITLVQALSKGDRFDLVVQKAVELGVDRLIPITSARNVVKLDEKRQQKKIAHWQGIIESASEQSTRNQLMQLDRIISLENYLKTPSQQQHVVLDPTSQHSLKSLAKPTQGIAFLIGPEGGFCQNEIALLQQLNIANICLGPRILRTETAAITICAIAQTLWGDL